MNFFKSLNCITLKQSKCLSSPNLSNSPMRKMRFKKLNQSTMDSQRHREVSRTSAAQAAPGSFPSMPLPGFATVDLMEAAGECGHYSRCPRLLSLGKRPVTPLILTTLIMTSVVGITARGRTRPGVGGMKACCQDHPGH